MRWWIPRNAKEFVAEQLRTVFAVDDSRVTITNDDSEKGENRRPGHDVNVGVTAHVSSHRSDT